MSLPRAVSLDLQDVADLSAAFPQLWADLALPPLIPPGAIFSSVLRLGSPGLALWTHYDVMDNLLVQIRGTKRVLLWPPLAAPDLYTQGSSSPVTDVWDPDLGTYPRYARAEPLVVDLGPGEAVFIPALWHHHVTSTQAGGWSMSVNVFWRHLDLRAYDPKDVYGNKDLVQAAKAERCIADAAAQLAAMPEPYRSFYCQRGLGALAAGAGLRLADLNLI